jgi:hypothetical protein
MLQSERLICRLLAGDTVTWTRAGTEPIDDFLEVGRYHGVLPLLDAKFQSGKDFAAWPQKILVACHEATLARIAYELAHGAEIERVLAALSNAAVTPLLLKGTGLAYSIYSSPMLRPRSDSDLLVPPELRETASRTLEKLGYDRIGGPAGKFVGYQLQLLYRDARGFVHNIDLHWRISNEQSFAWLFSFADLAAAAVPVRALDPRALRLGNIHALILCLLHRAGNNRFEAPDFGNRLIWLYDIHLLVAAMTDAELDDFRATIEIKRIGAIALDGLRRCAEQFPSHRLVALVDALARSPHAQSGSAVLSAGRLHYEWVELRALPDAASRVAYLAERAFPSREYMRERYPNSGNQSISILYARRFFDGIRRRIISSD